MEGPKLIDIHCHLLPGLDDGARFKVLEQNLVS